MGCRLHRHLSLLLPEVGDVHEAWWMVRKKHQFSVVLVKLLLPSMEPKPNSRDSGCWNPAPGRGQLGRHCGTCGEPYGAMSPLSHLCDCLATCPHFSRCLGSL